MDRSEWLKEKRREAEERYDTLWAPRYDEEWGVYRNTTHQQFLHQFLRLLPQPSSILDAACGAGRYMAMLLEQGHTVVGIDQSQGMLARAQAKFPTVRVEKVGLQEMRYQEAFDGMICMDALEHVCPEDWPLVLSNFQRALKPRGYGYFTVEVADAQDIEDAFRQGQQLGLPLVAGEWPDQCDVYHYYPPLPQVREWLQQAGLELMEEGDGDGYHHVIMCKAALNRRGQ
jgi:cyclopropane fatty-acyl-phospholipid synthase-like methyltransferase